MANHKQQQKNAPRSVQPNRGQMSKIGVEQDLAESVDDDEDEFDTSSSMVKVINVHTGTVKINIAGRKYRMEPGAIIEVEGGYGTPRIMRAGGDPLPSVVETESNRKVLPVADPRVDKDKETGTPIAHLAWKAKKDAEQRAKQDAARA